MCDSKPVLTLPRRFRLTRRDGFSRVLKQKAHTSPWFAIHVQPNNMECSRLGVTVSKRVVPSAVRRNGIKRQVREGFRLFSRQGAFSDVVVRLRKFPQRNEQQEARESLYKALRSILAGAK